MKRITHLVLFTFLIIGVQTSFGQKKSKKERRMEQFAETQKLVDTKAFTFVPNRAFPQGGRSIDLTTNYGFIKIMNTKTEGDMPFFGRGYNVSYGGDGGIKFKETTIEKEKIEVNKKKMRILYNFEAKGKNDTYRISMDISYSGNASVNVISNNRSAISYNGEISATEDKDEDE